MTRLKLVLGTTAAAAVAAVAAPAPSAMPVAAQGPPAGVPGPPASTPGLANGLPTPVCTPSWGTIVLPICV
jgi:hypothetical protein